jgi:hypothetical protein
MFECADGRWVCYWVPTPAFVLGAAAGDELAVSDETRPVADDPSRILPDPYELIVLHHYFPAMAKAFKRFPADDWVRYLGFATDVGDLEVRRSGRDQALPACVEYRFTRRDARSGHGWSMLCIGHRITLEQRMKGVKETLSEAFDIVTASMDSCVPMGG